MSMWTAASDRDHHEEVYDEGGPAFVTVPCVACRRAVRIEADQWMPGDPVRCQTCRKEFEASLCDVRRG